MSEHEEERQYVHAEGYWEHEGRWGHDELREALKAADAYDAERGVHRVSEDVLRAYDDLHTYVLATVGRDTDQYVLDALAALRERLPEGAPWAQE